MPTHLLRPMRVALATFALASALVSLPSALNAEGATDYGQVVQGPTAPFTETMKQMAERDAVWAAERSARIAAGLESPFPKVRRVPNREEEEEEGANKSLGPVTDVKVPLTFLANGTTAEKAAPAQSLSTNWIGTSFLNAAGYTNGDVNSFGFLNIPPDVQGAVGPNHALIMVNGSVRIFSRAGALSSAVSLDSFWTISGSPNFPNNGAFDPRVVYDRRSNRWFCTAMEIGGGSGVNNRIALAVTRTSDPTGTWDKYIISGAAAGASAFTDYSTLGLDDNGVYFGVTYFGTPSGNRLFATPKASLISASPSLSTVTGFTTASLFSGTPQPAVSFDATAPTDAAWVFGSGTTTDLRYQTVTWTGSVPAASSVSAFTVTTIATPPDAPYRFQSNPQSPFASTPPLTLKDTGDFRVLQCTKRGNRVWVSRTVGVNSAGTASSPDRTACEYLAVTVSGVTPTAVEQGRLFDTAASTPIFYYYPSIMPTGQGHAVMGLSKSQNGTTAGTGSFTDSAFTGRLSSDAAGFMSTTPTVTQVGANMYNIKLGDSRNRYGDYTYAALDPLDDMTVWTFQEFSGPFSQTVNTLTGSSSFPQEGGNWAVKVSRILAPAPTATAPGTSVAQGSTTNVAITGTGLYDPGAGFTNRLAAAFSGTGVTVNSVTFSSATSMSVNITVAGGATLGFRSLTVTNPDGQTTGAVANAINIIPAGSVQDWKEN